MIEQRISNELKLLRQYYPQVEYREHRGMHWFLLTDYKTPEPWKPEKIQIAFAVTQGHPNAEPYGFFVPAELNLNGRPPSEHSPSNVSPFEGNWRFLSWRPKRWRPSADLLTGDNLWGWARGFAYRLKEGQ
jgi:hypothetical protein